MLFYRLVEALKQNYSLSKMSLSNKITPCHNVDKFKIVLVKRQIVVERVGLGAVA
jgi:hypothetical protein